MSCACVVMANELPSQPLHTITQTAPTLFLSNGYSHAQPKLPTNFSRTQRPRTSHPLRRSRPRPRMTHRLSRQTMTLGARSRKDTGLGKEGFYGSPGCGDVDYRVPKPH